MQFFVREHCTMIAAPVQCDVDGIPKGSHYVRVPIAIGRPNEPATAAEAKPRRRASELSDRLGRGSWLDLDLAQHSEFSVFIGSSDDQLSLINQLQAEQVNVWSVTHKDHWRRTAVAGDQ